MKIDSPGSGGRSAGVVTISGAALDARDDDEAARARSGARGATFFCRANGTAAELSVLSGFDVFLLFFFGRAGCSSAATRFNGATFLSTAAGGLAGFRGFGTDRFFVSAMPLCPIILITNHESLIRSSPHELAARGSLIANHCDRQTSMFSGFSGGGRVPAIDAVRRICRRAGQ
jgi:hypothetical protein